MSEEHGNYRPRSPDLSAFAPPAPLNRLPSFHAPEPAFPPGYSFSPRGSYDASPYFSPQIQSASSYFGSSFNPPLPQSHSTQHSRTPSLPSGIPQSVGQSYGVVPRLENPQFRNTQPQPPAFDPSIYQNQQQSAITHSQPQPYFEMARTRQKKSIDEFDGDYDPDNSAPSRTTGMISKMEHPPPISMPLEPFDPTQNIDVKTKFPVARIKRIMQADEDVGKVAQATPTAVAKALELFMIALVAKGATEARMQNSKRVTAQHLKAGLMKDSQFDFLADTCAEVPDEGSKKGQRAKSEAKSEDSDEEMAAGKKKSKPRKRKVETDDETD